MTENEKNILAVTYEEKSGVMEFMDWVENVLNMFYEDLEESIADIQAMEN